MAAFTNQRLAAQARAALLRKLRADAGGMMKATSLREKEAAAFAKECSFLQATAASAACRLITSAADRGIMSSGDAPASGQIAGILKIPVMKETMEKDMGNLTRPFESGELEELVAKWASLHEKARQRKNASLRSLLFDLTAKAAKGSFSFKAEHHGFILKAEKFVNAYLLSVPTE